MATAHVYSFFKYSHAAQYLGLALKLGEEVEEVGAGVEEVREEEIVRVEQVQ